MPQRGKGTRQAGTPAAQARGKSQLPVPLPTLIPSPNLYSFLLRSSEGVRRSHRLFFIASEDTSSQR